MGFRLEKTVIVLSLGFIFILVPLLILVAVAVNRIQDNINRIDSVVHQQNTKIELVTIMLSAARERSLLMMEMHLTDDPFERDEQMLVFNRHGGTFAQSRMELLQMRLSPEELDILNEQGALTQKVVPLQRQIVDMLFNDDFEEQTKMLLIEQAIPMQDQVFATLKKLLNEQQQAADRSFQEAVIDYKNTVLTITFLALGVFSTCILISIYIVRRITRSENLLFREKERAQVTLHSIGDGVITTNIDGIIEYMNNEAEVLTGWSNEDAKGKAINLVCSIRREDNHEHHIFPIEEVITSQRMVNSKGNSIIKQKNDKEFAVEYTASPIFNSEGKLDGVIIVFRNVTEMRLLNHKLSYQATHDALTGLINRVEFEYLTDVILQESKGTLRQHGLCYMDLDQFKVINDTCGHLAGDELLKQLATLLKSQLRDSDIVSRLGGDEFGIIFRDCEIEKAEEILESLRESISTQRFNWDNKSFNMSVSAGLVAFSGHSGSLYDLFSSVDSACYVAKEQGRNRVHVYRENDLVMSARKGEMQWVHRITRALEEDRFQLYYQTIAPLADDKKDSLSCELLIRMIGENGEPIPPMAFIPAAERYNLMSSIDKWVIQEALSIISEFSDRLLVDKCHFSVNISAQSLSDDKFLRYIQNQFKAYNVSPSLFCFEITETTAIANLTIAKSFMTTLKEMGCKFSLDDFGSGLSSFEYLKNLPVDFLKIDGAFVKNLINDQVDKAMVQSINQVGHVMGIGTIAEFAENPEIINVLKEIGVDYAQGYGVSHPKKFDALVQTKSIGRFVN